MKILCCCFLLALTLPSPPTLRAQAANLPKTVAEACDRSVAGSERAIVAIARAMPEDRYSFSPTVGEFKGVRNFAQMLKHVAVDNYVNGAALLRENPPIEVGAHENGPDSLAGKEEILKFVQDSFAYLHKAVQTVTEKTLMQAVDYPGGGQVTRLTVVLAASAHPWDLYGQMVEYLRMNGIDPQATR